MTTTIKGVQDFLDRVTKSIKDFSSDAEAIVVARIGEIAISVGNELYVLNVSEDEDD